MESIGKHLPLAEEEDEDEFESDEQLNEFKMEDVQQQPSTTSHGVKRKHGETSAVDATSTMSSPSAAVAEAVVVATTKDPREEPAKKPKSLKIRLSLSKGEVKTVKLVNSEQRRQQQQQPSSSAAVVAAASSPPPPTTTKSRQPSSKRIKLSLPKSKPMTSTTKTSIEPPATNSSSTTSAAASAASSSQPAKQTAIKKRRSSIGTGNSSNNNNNNNNNNAHGNSSNNAAANAVANATILPMTSPGLLVVGAGKNNLIPPRVIFDQAMAAAGYTTESRSTQPHRGSSVRRVVGDMFDSTTTFTYHFPRLVPHEFLKRPEESSSKTTTPKKLKATATAPGAPPDVVGAASSKTATTTTTTTTTTASSTSGPSKITLATTTPATVPSASNATPTSSALPASGNVNMEEAVLVDVTTPSPAHSADTKNVSTTALVPTVVASTASSTDMAEPEFSICATSDGPVPMDMSAEAPVVQQPTTEAENAKSSTASTTEPPRPETGPSTAPVAPAPSTIQPQESTVVNSSSQLQEQPPKQHQTEKEATPSTLPEKTGSELDVPSTEESAEDKSKRIKAEARAFALSSPPRPSKGERKLSSVAERFIKAFSAKEEKKTTDPTKSKSNSSAVMRSFSGMIPVSLTLPYPDDFLQRQARYLKEVRQREKAIVAKQHDMDSIEIAKERSEILGRPYDGPMASKVIIPPIPQLPRPPKLTEMKALDVEIFGTDSENRLYPLKNTRNDHLDPHCFNISDGRYFGLESNQIADPNFIGPNAPGFNGLSMSATNSLSGMGGSSVPLLSASAMALLEANAKSEASSNKLKGKKTPTGSSVQRPAPKRDERGKFISKKNEDKAAKPIDQGQVETMNQPLAAAVPVVVSNLALS